MRILTALLAAAMLFVAASGCHEKKNQGTTPSGSLSDGGAPPTAPAYPPAQ